MGSYQPEVFPDGAPAALQLISYDSDTGLVECGQEALACLRSIKTPVGVIAVTGRARTGKSYILNQLLGQSTGFKLAHSHRPCTKGLWIWSQPIKRIGPDGNPYHLVSPQHCRKHHTSAPPELLQEQLFMCIMSQQMLL